jgi:hypothetical protein
VAKTQEASTRINEGNYGNQAIRKLDDLQYFVGTWLARAEDPGTGRKFTLQYRIEPTLDGTWLAGAGKSPEMALEIQDRWGHDPVTGEIIRVIFDSHGTVGTVKSKGWDGDKLVFEGEARAKEGALPVRETIHRRGSTEFKAVWETRLEKGWTAYSVEHLIRQ